MELERSHAIALVIGALLCWARVHAWRERRFWANSHHTMVLPQPDAEDPSNAPVAR